MASTLIMLARPPNWGQLQKRPFLRCHETTADFKLSSVHVFLKITQSPGPGFASELLQPSLCILQPTSGNEGGHWNLPRTLALTPIFHLSFPVSFQPLCNFFNCGSWRWAGAPCHLRIHFPDSFIITIGIWNRQVQNAWQPSVLARPVAMETADRVGYRSLCPVPLRSPTPWTDFFSAVMGADQ